MLLLLILLLTHLVSILNACVCVRAFVRACVCVCVCVLFCAPINSYGHDGTVGLPNYTFSKASLTKWLTNASYTLLCL